jgi:hypothetical protein
MSRSPTLPAPPCQSREKRLETILGVNQQIGVHGFHRVDIGFDIVRTDIQSVEPRPRLSGETETFDSPVMALIRVLLTNPISAIGGRRQGVCEIVIRLGCCLGAGASRRRRQGEKAKTRTTKPVSPWRASSKNDDESSPFYKLEPAEAGLTVSRRG